MKLIDKKNIDEQIGKSSLWTPKKITGLCEYVAGIEDIDAIIGQKDFLKVKPLINFLIHESGLEISIVHGFKMSYLALKNTDITSINIEKGGVIDTEGRSVIGRAIVGGLLLGPLGAIVGGVSGTKDKITKEKDNLVIILKSDEKEQAIIFEIKKGKTTDVYKFFKENYRSVFSMI